jgi:predicted DNA-binding protein with PD1-like motif
MEYFSTEGLGRAFILRLDHGDYVLESIVGLINEENLKDAVVVGLSNSAFSRHHIQSKTSPEAKSLRLGPRRTKSSLQRHQTCPSGKNNA